MFGLEPEPIAVNTLCCALRLLHLYIRLQPYRQAHRLFVSHAARCAILRSSVVLEAQPATMHLVVCALYVISVSSQAAKPEKEAQADKPAASQPFVAAKEDKPKDPLSQLPPSPMVLLPPHTFMQSTYCFLLNRVNMQLLYTYATYVFPTSSFCAPPCAHVVSLSWYLAAGA